MNQGKSYMEWLSLIQKQACANHMQIMLLNIKELDGKIECLSHS